MEKSGAMIVVLSMAIFCGLGVVGNCCNSYTENDLMDPLYDENLNEVPEKVLAEAQSKNGLVFVSTMINLLDTEFDRPFGGYRPDNAFWFGNAMPFDNVESFQLGVIEVVQRTALFLKERVSRAGGGSDSFDKSLETAAMNLNYNQDSMFLTSMKYDDGLDNLIKYRSGLVNGSSRFLVRTDALFDLFRLYSDMIGAEHHSLAKMNEADGSPVAFSKTDDYYYHALGVSYATMAFMRAVEIEWGGILKEKGSAEIIKSALQSLETATKISPPPMVMNGDRDAWFLVNHRSNLDTDLYDVRFKLLSMMDNIIK